jgi:hypothetical protein
VFAQWDHDGDPGPADEDIPHSFYDGDDGEIRHYGRATNAATTRAVTALVDRYYRAVTMGDDVSACSLVAGDLVRALVEQAGELPSRRYHTAGACPAVISRQFARAPGRNAGDLAAVAVIGVRIEGKEGLALLRMSNAEVRDIPVGREGGRWKLEAIVDNGLP